MHWSSGSVSPWLSIHHLFHSKTHFYFSSLTINTTIMKRASASSSLGRSISKKRQNCSNAEQRNSKLASEQGGKSYSAGRASSLSERSHSVSSNPKVSRFPVPSVVSPGKSVRSFSNQSIVKHGSSESRLQCVSINWLSCSMTVAEIRKYKSEDDMIPKSQEDQLEYLMDKFSLADLKSAYHVMAGKIGVDISSVLLPYNARKDIVKSYFIAMIYDHRSMMYNDTRSAFR
jgi:hypothetical protein